MQINSFQSSVFQTDIHRVETSVHPFLQALEKKDEEALLNFSEEALTQFLFNEQTFVEKLSSFLKCCLLTHELSFKARYRAARILRKMIIPICISKPHLFNQHMDHKLKELLLNHGPHIFENENSLIFEWIVIQEMMQAKQAGNDGFMACRDKICNSVNQSQLLDPNELTLFISHLQQQQATPDQTEKVLDSISQKLFNECLDKRVKMAYFASENTLQLNAIVRLPNGEIMTKLQLYLRNIESDPKHSMTYNNLACAFNQNGNIQRIRGERLEIIKHLELRDGSMMTQQQLLLKAIALDSNNSEAYYNLACTLSPDRSIELPNKQTLTQQQLFLKAIELKPDYSLAYSNLADTLRSNESVTFPNGQTVTKQQLFLKVIELNPNDSTAYYKLADALRPNESVTFPNEQTLTKQQLLLKIIELNPNDSTAYYKLADTLASYEGVDLPNGQTLTQQQLFLKAIELNPKHSMTYNNLACSLSPGESFELPDGRTLTKQQLFLRAIDLDSHNSMAYCNLANTIPSRGCVKLLNGKIMSQLEVFEKGEKLKKAKH